MKDIIVIIGGGIAGLEVAKQLLMLGYSPIIVEKSDEVRMYITPKITPATTATIAVERSE